MTAALLLSLKVTVGTIILAIGMDSRFSDLAYLWGRSWLLVRSLVAMYVLVPLVALALIKLLTLPESVEIGLLVLAVSSGAPLLPLRLMHLERSDYVISLVVITTLLAMFVVPGWLILVSSHFYREVELEPTRIALVLAESFFLPLLAGMLIRRLFPGVAGRFSAILMRVAGGLMALSVVAILILHRDMVLEARLSGVLTVAALTISALGIGHWMGGPVADNRTALAVACATRHIGMVVLAAATAPGPRTAVLAAAYILPAVSLTIPYVWWRKKRSNDSRGPA